MRKESKNDAMESKTVIINFSPDLSEQTTELMTLFFTYQTFHEKIDILDISGEVNPTLQQGCDITGGRYVPLEAFPNSLLGCIAVCFCRLSYIQFNMILAELLCFCKFSKFISNCN